MHHPLPLCPIRGHDTNPRWARTNSSQTANYLPKQARSWLAETSWLFEEDWDELTQQIAGSPAHALNKQDVDVVNNIITVGLPQGQGAKMSRQMMAHSFVMMTFCLGVDYHDNKANKAKRRATGSSPWYMCVFSLTCIVIRSCQREDKVGL